MPPNFPTSLDSLANPTPTTLRNAPGFSLSAQVSTLNDIVEALEAKLGTGASVPGPTAGVLRRTAAGASAWGQVAQADMGSNSVQGGAGGPNANILTGSIIASDLAAGTGLRKLAETVLGGAASTIDFPNISQAYGSLLLAGEVANTTTISNALLAFSFDGTTFDVGANYDYLSMTSVNNATSALTILATTGILAGVTTATQFTPCLVDLPLYSQAGLHHGAFARMIRCDSQTAAGLYLIQAGGMHKSNTAAIRGLRLYQGAGGQFAAGTRIALYGLAGTTG